MTLFIDYDQSIPLLVCLLIIASSGVLGVILLYRRVRDLEDAHYTLDEETRTTFSLVVARFGDNADEFEDLWEALDRGVETSEHVEYAGVEQVGKEERLPFTEFLKHERAARRESAAPTPLTITEDIRVIRDNIKAWAVSNADNPDAISGADAELIKVAGVLTGYLSTAQKGG